MNYNRLFIDDSLVFITIVTSKRREILIDNIDLLREAFKKSINNYKFEIYAISVMHDHIHMIIKPNPIKSYPMIVKQIKTYFSKNIDIESLNDYELRLSNIKKQERDVWQRRYYEHTIKDEKDLYRHLDYIHYNSMKHYNIVPFNWTYSTFDKFVQSGFYENDWCNFSDKNDILSMDLE